ncbi:MAG: hypothetical protein ACT4QB_13550 [Gammaproteobacteria bacterium]
MSKRVELIYRCSHGRYGFETELGYDSSRFFAAMSYSETRARDATKSEPLTSVPPDTLVATLGLRLPELGLVFTGRGRFVKRQDELPAGVPITPGCDLYASWLPKGAGYSGLRVDFGIENLTDKSCRPTSRSSMRPGAISSSRSLTGSNGEVNP